MKERAITTSPMRPPRMSGWWSASIVLHAAVLIAVSQVKPAPIALTEESSSSASSQQMQEVMAEAQAAQAQSLSSKLDQLQEAKEKLDESTTAKLKQYAENAKPSATQPIAMPDQARQEIEKAQQDALSKQNALKDLPDSTELKQIEDAQARALSAQDQMMRSLEQSANHDELIQQDRARQAQLEAQAAQAAATRAQLAATGQTPEGKKALDEARQAEEDIAEAEETLKNARGNLAKLKADLEKAQAATQPAAPLDAKAVKKAQQNFQKAGDRVTKAQNDVAKAQTNVDSRKQKLSGATAGKSSGSAAAKSAQSAASDAQARANQLQSDIGKSGATLQNSSRQNLSEVYAEARARESAMFDQYRQLRAAELAMLREITLTDALKLIDVPRPKRPDFDPNLLDGKTGTPDQMASAIKAVSSEIESITTTARRIAEDSQSRSASGNLSSSWIRQQTEATRRNDQLALQDAGVVAKDLTAVMGGGAGSGGSGSSGSGSSGSGSSGSGSGTAGSGEGGSGGSGTGGSGNGLGTGGSGVGGGAGGGAGNAGPGNGGGASKLAGELGQSLRQEASRDVRAIPGRRVGTGSVSFEPGRKSQWMFIDSWYLIGPWPNPSRSEINTRFPPETIVDFDASYITKANQRVAWKYHQATAEMIAPPGMKEYEIYYACSELWFDSPQDLWIAIGSDDQSQVWIEDHLIWKSSSAHKDWNVIEGFRKVHFKQGRNRVLVRLENGHGKGGFSFVINLDPKFGPDN